MEPEGPIPSIESPGGQRRRRAWWAGAVGVLALGALALLISPGGPALVSIESPEDGETVGIEGVWVMVRVPDDERVEADSLRVLLNGADVTPQLTTGQNGAVGRLHGLLDGENVLRVEVRARSFWSDDRHFERRREVRFFARRPLDLDRG